LTVTKNSRKDEEKLEIVEFRRIVPAQQQPSGGTSNA